MANREVEERGTQEFYVMATSGEKKSSISNILTTDQISSRAIIELNHEKNSEVFESLPKIDIDEDKTPQSLKRLEQFPTHLYVTMGDESFVTAPVDFDLDYLEFSEHEKYGMLAQVRYKVRGTSLVRVKNLFVDERIGDFTAKSDKSEFYKVEENFFDEDKVVDEIVEQIKKNGKAVVRTSYNLTESEAVEIINKAVEKGGFKVTDAYTWLGVISVEGK
ncbi:MAG: hypothetical protein ACRCWG_16340 [Sarcina sp.]